MPQLTNEEEIVKILLLVYQLQKKIIGIMTGYEPKTSCTRLFQWL